ncbi:hypothetical protein [Streptomyces sp. enrichment culture]|uniref:hypothetical protein n=1 Tax=Streptomyces sp. enrichment culture TaxID=1795815 RepID=UPI003F57A225
MTTDADTSILPRYPTEPALHAGSLEQLHRSPAPPSNALSLVTRSSPLATFVRAPHQGPRVA